MSGGKACVEAPIWARESLLNLDNARPAPAAAVDRRKSRRPRALNFFVFWFQIAIAENYNSISPA
jgi:hypothetical protein